MLLFRAGGEPKAVPLGLVARLEDIPRDKIEISCGEPVTQYRGKLMPLVRAVAAAIDTAEAATQPVLVFADGDRSMGLMVDEIVDVVEDRLNIELSGARPGLLGTAVIAGQATDVIDTGYWLTQAWQDWFRGAPRTASRAGHARAGGGGQRLLPPAAGAVARRRRLQRHRRGQCGRGVAAARGGGMFDAIVSDIEMPDMDGLDFARAVRAGGAWASLPMIALPAHAEPRDVEAGREAGFTDYVAKFEREALIASLQQCLANRSRRDATASEPARTAMTPQDIIGHRPARTPDAAPR